MLKIKSASTVIHLINVSHIVFAEQCENKVLIELSTGYRLFAETTIDELETLIHNAKLGIK